MRDTGTGCTIGYVLQRGLQDKILAPWTTVWIFSIGLLSESDDAGYRKQSYDDWLMGKVDE